MTEVETSTPPDAPKPLGPYSHITKVGRSITIGGIGGVDPETGLLAGDDVHTQTVQILNSFKTMLQGAGSDLDYIVHINIFLKEMSDFDRMNEAYVEVLGDRRPARTVIGVAELPNPDFRLTMNLTAVVAG